MWRPFSFHGEVVGLEIARGHDGLLRGDPEPVVVVGAYLLNPPYVQVVGRSLHRFQAHIPFPSTATTKDRSLPAGSIQMPKGAPRWVVLALALEEDGGLDVQRAFGALEHHAALSVWASEERDVEPYGLSTIPATPTWFLPRAVQLQVDGAPFAGTCRSDKWIGAVCWMLEGREPPDRARYRLPFLAEDRRNDWTAVLDVTR